MTLERWGREAQERVKSSRVLIAGAGGVSTSMALYLLAGGVGAVQLLDPHRVELADLSHQFLFKERDLGKPKAQVAARVLREVNPFAVVESQAKALSEHNLPRLTSGFHLLIDASNNPTSALLLNQAAVKLQVALVHAWVWNLNGRLGTFWPGQGPCLECQPLNGGFDAEPASLGPMTGIIGALQALEALRILGGMGPGLLGRLLVFRGHPFQFSETHLRPNLLCQRCQTKTI